MTSPRARFFALLVLVIVAAGAIYLQVLARRMGSQNTEREEVNARARLAEAALSPESGPQQTVTLFIPASDQSVLIQEPYRLALAAGNEDRIRQIFLALNESTRRAQEGASQAGAELRSVFLAPDGTAYLDLSSGSLPLLTPGIGSETQAVYSIVDSIAVNVPAVQRVKFLIQGQEVDTLDGHVDLTQAFVPDANAKALVQ
ncbi:MAG: GerMN domain-containing protein [Deltaproteobacteria bacterium]